MDGGKGMKMKMKMVWLMNDAGFVLGILLDVIILASNLKQL